MLRRWMVREIFDSMVRFVKNEWNVLERKKWCDFRLRERIKLFIGELLKLVVGYYVKYYEQIKTINNKSQLLMKFNITTYGNI